MDDGLPLFINLTALIIFVLAHGFFVAAEVALLRSRESLLQENEFRGRFGVKAATRLLRELERSLTTTTLGSAAASVLLGWWGLDYFVGIFESQLVWLEDPIQGVVVPVLSVIAALGVVLSAHVIVGEFVAKAIAVRSPELTLLMVATPTLALSVLLSPFVEFFRWIGALLLRLFGLSEGSLAHLRSSAEFAVLVSKSGALGVINEQEEQMLHGVFQFAGTVAREVMTPRTDLVTADAKASYDELLEVATESGFSRLPICSNRVDDVIGVLLVKDLLSVSPDEKGKFDVRRYVREPYFVPGTKSIHELLKDFKERKLHMAVVLDEHGGVDGVVTLEDLIEEIVGDIFDESDVEEKMISVGDSGELIVDGGVLVSDLNFEHSLGIPEGDYDTIAGFVFSSFGQIPNVGEFLEVGSNGQVVVSDSGSFENGIKSVVRITIQKVAGHRVESLSIKRQQLRDLADRSESDPESLASDNHAAQTRVNES